MAWPGFAGAAPAQPFENSFTSSAAIARVRSADPSALTLPSNTPRSQHPTAVAAPISVSGRRHADVLVLLSASPAPRVEVLSGRSGATVWSRAIPGAYAVEQALIATARSRRALVVYATTSTMTSSPDGSYTAHESDVIEALDGKSGELLWRWHSSGEVTWIANGPASISMLTNVIEPAGILRQPSGDDVLAVRVSTSRAGADVTPVVLSGADGSWRSNGPTSTGQYGVTATPAGDLSGDSYDDFVVVSHNDAAQPSGPSEIAAYSGADGAALWRRQYAVVDLSVSVGMRLSHDDQPDMIAQLERSSGDVVHALNGRDGSCYGTALG